MISGHVGWIKTMVAYQEKHPQQREPVVKDNRPHPQLKTENVLCYAFFAVENGLYKKKSSKVD